MISNVYLPKLPPPMNEHERAIKVITNKCVQADFDRSVDTVMHELLHITSININDVLPCLLNLMNRWNLI